MAKRLTARSIELVKPDPRGRIEIPDAGKPGLYLVIQPSGRKSWAVRYRRLSDRTPRKLTLEGFPSLATAHKLAQAALDKAAEGLDPAAEKKGGKANRAGTKQRFRRRRVQGFSRQARPQKRWHADTRNDTD